MVTSISSRSNIFLLANLHAILCTQMAALGLLAYYETPISFVHL